MQLQKHTKYRIINRYRSWFNRLKLGYLGKKVFIDRNVGFLRFPKNIIIGDNVFIKEGVKLCPCNKNSKIKIGDRTTIGYYTFIFASDRISIGEDCMIAPFVYLVDSDHGINKRMKMNSQPNTSESITIGDDVWIASNVTVLKGVNIASGAVIAANSLVNCNVGKLEIWAGTPARKIGMRE